MSASSESERMPQRQLGELMTELGLISDEQLATVLEVQQQSKRPLGQIIVELGFASGAAVAHALAMQSGGALKTEYGFALGVPPKEDANDAGDEASGTLPKLRLAPTASAPAVRPSLAPVEDTATEDSPAAEDTDEEPTTVATEVEEVEEVEDAAEVETVDAVVEETEADDADQTAEVAAETEESPDAEEPEELSEETETTPEAPVEETERLELEQLRAEIERLEGALAEAKIESEQQLARLQEERDQATAGLERLQTTLAEAQTERTEDLTQLREERDQATAELDRLQTALAEAESSATEYERRLAEAHERHAGERDELTAHRDRLQHELDDALERAASVAPVAEERDRLRTEVGQFESTLAESQAVAAQERERLLADVDRLENAVAEAQAAALAEHARDQDELDRLRTAVAEAQASAAEQERRLAEEQERHAGERDELTVQRERLQEELGNALERLAAIGPAVEERDELRTRVELIGTTLADVRESSAAELRGVVDERDKLAAELEEAHELLRQAERVRDSQIALEAERDRAVSELERVQAVAADAQAELEEQTRLLAEEQDRHNADHETLLAQRTVLEQELGSAIEQLAAAASAADAREHQLQLGSQRLVDALEVVRGLASDLVSGEEPADEPLAEECETELETEATAEETEWLEPVAESEEVDYSLFVPGPNGYELVPQTGVPPRPGQTVELVFPDREEPAVFEVVRSGRTLPGGDICVYLAQV